MDAINQISIFAQNRTGQIERITKVLTKDKINILAITMSSTGRFGVIKLMVDKSNLAFKRLKDNGFTVSQNQVLAILMKDKPGGLYEVARILTKKKINVDNAYVFVRESRKTAYLIIEVNEIEKVYKILRKVKLEFLKEKDISKE